MMIILTQEEAEQVRGPTAPGAALDPIALADGVTWVLPEIVLSAPEHEQHRDFLSQLPARDVAPEEFFTPSEEEA